jgi:hypothetical protein
MGEEHSSHAARAEHALDRVAVGQRRVQLIGGRSHE